MEILVTESIERPRRIIEAIHTKFAEGALNEAIKTYAAPLINASQLTGAHLRIAGATLLMFKKVLLK